MTTICCLVDPVNSFYHAPAGILEKYCCGDIYYDDERFRAHKFPTLETRFDDINALIVYYHVQYS